MLWELHFYIGALIETFNLPDSPSFHVIQFLDFYSVLNFLNVLKLHENYLNSYEGGVCKKKVEMYIYFNKAKAFLETFSESGFKF